MKTTFDALDWFFPILDVASVKATLTTAGRVYRRKRPIDSSERDIVLVTLPLQSLDGDIIQQGTLIVKLYCPNLDSGRPDESHLEAMVDAAEGVLESYKNTSSTYFDFDILSENLMQDPEDEKSSYASLRINFYIQI